MRRDGASQARIARRGSSMPWAFSPFAMMRRMAEEMERSFENLGWSTGSPEREFGERGWSPQIEMFEREGRLVVHADLPGMSREDVDVEVRDDVLILVGERRKEHEENRGSYYHSERTYGRFYRSIPLPEGVNPDQVEATFRDGVLEVQMPLPEQKESRGRRVEIK